MGACYAWEVEDGAGSVGFYAAGVDSGKGSLQRTPSVDDLFAPLWRLDVRQQTLAPQAQESAEAGMGSNSNCLDLESCGPGAKIPQIEKSQSSGIPTNGQIEIPGAQLPYSPATVGADVLPSTSASDEDHLVIDDKKQKRMISNRESARRSRLRKQQHLEDLRSQLLELRAQNSHIVSKLSMASQQFSQLNHDNQILRMHAVELSSQLQLLHQQATAHHPDGLHAFGFGTSHLDPPGVAVGSSSSAYSIVTNVLQGGMCA